MSEEFFDHMTEFQEPIAAAKLLADNVQNSYYDLGCMLFYIKERDIYKLVDNKKYYSDNHSKWKQFCEENFSVSYRTAQYWLNLYRYFSDMGIDKEKVSKIGWSKAKELIDFTEDTNILNHALDIAEKQTMQELKHYIAEIKSGTQKSGEDTREEVKFKEFKFKFFEAAAESMEQILQEAMKDTNGDKNEAMFKIFLEWYQDRNYSDQNIDNIVIEYDEEALFDQQLEKAGL